MYLKKTVIYIIDLLKLNNASNELLKASKMIMLFEISNYFYSPDFISNETQIEGFFFLTNNQFKYF